MCEPVAHCSADMDSGCPRGRPEVGVGGCGNKTPQGNRDGYHDVDRIKDKRRVRGTTQYLVKWVNPLCKDKWEPIESFLDPQVVIDFEEEYARKKRAPKKGKSVPKPPAGNKTVGSTSTSGRGTVSPKSTPKMGSVGNRSAKKKSEVTPTAPARMKANFSTSGRKVPPAPRPCPSPRSCSNRAAHAELEKICGGDDTSGQLQYVVKYKGEKAQRIVSAAEIHADFPQVALAFYVGRRAFEME